MLRFARHGVLLAVSAVAAVGIAKAQAQTPPTAAVAPASHAHGSDKAFKKPIALGFTKLVVEDVDAMSKFYQAVCGFEEEGRADAEIGVHPIREVYFRADPPGTGTFTLTKFLDAKRPVTQAVILGFIAPNIVEFVDRATKAGGTLVMPIESQPQHGVKVAFVKDIEGNMIEVVELL